MLHMSKNTKSAFSKNLSAQMASHWRTPPELYAQLDSIYHFTLDAYGRENNVMCSEFFPSDGSGLSKSWRGHRVFCFPPSGAQNSKLWTAKALSEANGKDTLVVMLLPSSTDTGWFHKNILGQPGVEVYFPDRRLVFENPITPSYSLNNVMKVKQKKGSGSMRPSMIVVFTGAKRKFRCGPFHVET